MPRARRCRLSLERLEDRCVPALLGAPWPNPGQLTFSIAPDGANVAGAPSVLAQTLNTQLSSSDWQSDISRAFNSWSSVGPVAFLPVSDDGSPLGQAPAPEGNPNFGDVRIVAAPLASGTVATSTPYISTGGWSGTIILNCADSFTDGGAAGTYDLYSVLLYEVGQVLGLPDSTDPNSAMFGISTGTQSRIDGSDVAALQSLYGTSGTSTSTGPSTGPSTSTPFVSPTASTTLSTSAPPATDPEPAPLIGPTPLPPPPPAPPPDPTDPLYIVPTDTGINDLYYMTLTDPDSNPAPSTISY